VFNSICRLKGVLTDGDNRVQGNSKLVIHKIFITFIGSVIIAITKV